MSTMNTTVTITYQRLREDIYNKGYAALETVEDVKLRDKLRPDEDKIDEIDRCIVNADVHLRALLQLPLVSALDGTSSDVLGNPVSLTYVFSMTPRHADKGGTLGQNMHEFIVDEVLMDWFSNVGQTGLAGTYAQRLTNDTARLMSLVHTKREPSLS